MSETDQSGRIVDQRRETAERQARAADPSQSAWVSANAGTGKTHVLTNRVLRLLVAGTKPERLLCLTYTKAAAAEMSARVFQRLARWVTADPVTLARELETLLASPPGADVADRARDLFTAAIETPGGLKVQTIHAFCERLLQRFPLEAGVPPGFQILDEDTKAALVNEATEAVLAAATSDRDGELGAALLAVVAYAHDDSFDDVLAQALGHRDWIETARRLKLGESRDLAAAATLYRRGLGLTPKDSRTSIDAALAGVVSDSLLAGARDLLAGGKKTDIERAGLLAAALGAKTPARRIAALTDFFLTSEGEPRKNLMTVTPRNENPALNENLVVAQGHFHELLDRRSRVIAADATTALLRLASAVMQRFHTLKQDRAALDFDDLIRAAGSLLRLGEDAQWVLYKLDGGLDHILVDEAQDTSPQQWRVVEALAREFFAGAGAREAETGASRTVFAVGDEKQSIYGFQGAAPKMFGDMGARFEGMTRDMGLPFARIPLTLSFRTVSPILALVDAVFADPVRAEGLTSGGVVQRHAADRLGEGGLVELWEPETPDKTEPAPVWQPLDEAAVSSPVTRLAERIADTIAGWIDSGERLVSRDRPITAGDVLILVRKRRPFADAMVTALKKRGVPVAGADRLRLGDQLAVRDLMALADFLLLPEDDLSLAAVLKSPLFGLDDDDLLAIAPKRRGSLWTALLAAVRNGDQPRLVEAAETLKRWRSRGDISPPYEFLAEVLVNDGMRQRLLARLGPEAADAIDELLGLALIYDEQAPPSLQGFMDWLRASDREIKRDMEQGRNEVRVMTVHGSKGLEAPIVFLPDTCTAPTGSRAGGLIAFPDMARPEEEPEPFLWPVKGTSGMAAVRQSRATIRSREAQEHNRLLYVALTRARDRLIVAGFEGARGRADGCWYESIASGLLGDGALAGGLVESTDRLGNRIRRITARQTAALKSQAEQRVSAVVAQPRPEWTNRLAPREAGLTVPLAPSRLAPLETDQDGDPVEPKGRAPGAGTVSLLPVGDGLALPSAPPPRVLADANRFLRGTITHALLQHLPAFDRDQWEAAAQRFVQARASGLGARTQASIVAETLGVLRDPAFAAVFGPDSRAEVPIAALIACPHGKGPPVRLAGQLDRIVVGDHEVMIVDFKTNRPPPIAVADVPDAYVLQLAAYRVAVRQIYGDRPVRAALLWTDGPRLMELPAERLDKAADALFKLQAEVTASR